MLDRQHASLLSPRWRTSYGGALKLRPASRRSQAILLGAIFEFLGAMTMGQFVSKTISKGVLVPSAFVDDSQVFALNMFCILAAAAVITLIATIYGYPTSTTHGVVGGLIAVGLASGGTAALDTTGITKTVVAWVASPIAGLLTAGLLYWVIHFAVISANKPKIRSLRSQPVFVVLTVFVATCALVIKGPEAIKITPVWAAILVALAIGVGVAIFVELAKYIRRRYRQSHPQAPPSPADREDGTDMATLAVGKDGVQWSQEWVENDSGERHLVITDKSPSTSQPITAEASLLTSVLGPSFGVTLPPAADTLQMTYADHLAQHGEAPGDEHGALIQLLRVAESVESLARAQAQEDAEVPFVPLLICSALSVAFAHGGNDVGNAVGILRACAGRTWRSCCRIACNRLLVAPCCSSLQLVTFSVRSNEGRPWPSPRSLMVARDGRWRCCRWRVP